MATLIQKLAARPWTRQGVAKASPWEVQAGETVVERTRGGRRTSYDAEPWRGRITAAVGPVHYRQEFWNEGEAWKEIDLDVLETPGESWDAACESNGYQIRFWDSREVGGKTIRCIAEFRQAGGWMRVAPLALYWINGAGDRQLISRTQAATRTIDNDAQRVTWTDAFGSGRHFRYNLRADECFKTVIVDSDTDLPTPTIPTAGLHLVVVMAVSWGGGSGNALANDDFATAVTVDDLTGEDDPVGAPDEEWAPDRTAKRWHDGLHDLIWLQPPKAWDSRTVDTDTETLLRPRIVDATWRFRRYGNRALLLVGVSAVNLQQATFPVYLDATMTQESVGASSDDAKNNGSVHPGDGSYAHDDSYAEVGYQSPNWQMFGFRFTSIPIAQGAAVTAAHLDVYCTSGETKYVIGAIAAEDVDDAATFASSTHEPYDSYVARTTAHYYEGPSNDWTASAYNEWPECGGCMNEVINRGSWASNNDIVFVVWCKDTIPSGDQYHVFSPYDAGSNYPTLDAEYDTTRKIVEKTWTWDSGLESWSGDSGAVDITYTRETADGDPTNGCLQARITGNNNVETGFWELTGIDWEDLGVPSGATVHRVRMSNLAWRHNERVNVDVCNIGDSTPANAVQWRDSGGSDTLQLWAGKAVSATATYFDWEDAGAWGAVPANDQASTTSIEFRLYCYFDLASGGGTAAALRCDRLSIQVEYSEVSKHDITATLTASGGGSAAGVAVGAPTATLSATGGGSAAGTCVSKFTSTLSATGGGSAAGTAVSLLTATLVAVGGGSAAGIAMAAPTATFTATGGGSAAGIAMAAPTVTLDATGGGSAAGTCVSPFTVTLTSTGGGSAAGTCVSSLTVTLTATGGGSAAGTVEDPGTKHDVTATLTATGGGSAAGTCVSPLAVTFTSTGNGSAAGTCVSPLTSTLGMAGGGLAAGTCVSPLTATLTATGGGSAAGQVYCPLTATLTASGGGSAAGLSVAMPTATFTATGGGSAAGISMAAPTVTLAMAGGGLAAGTAVSVLTVTLTATGGGSAAGTVIEPGEVEPYISFGQVAGESDAELLSGTLSEDLSLALLLNMGAGEEVRDYARQLNTLTMQTGMTESAWVAGPHGWALRFDGADDYLEGNAEQEPQWDGWGRGQHTFAAWIKLNGAAGSTQYIQGHTILGKGGGHPNGFMWGITAVAGTELRLHVNSANIDSVETMVTGQWYHVATVIDEGASEIRHYVNGVEDIVAHSSWGGDNAANLRMGANATNDRSNADIACVFAWSRSLTAAEVREHLRDTYGEFTRPEWGWTPTVLLPRLPAEATIDALWASGALAADYAEGAVGTDVAIGRIDRT